MIFFFFYADYELSFIHSLSDRYKKFPVDKDGLRTRKEIRREQKLTLLASDVLETDPRVGVLTCVSVL